jgi:hypothetical protein
VPAKPLSKSCGASEHASEADILTENIRTAGTGQATQNVLNIQQQVNANLSAGLYQVKFKLLIAGMKVEQSVELHCTLPELFRFFRTWLEVLRTCFHKSLEVFLNHVRGFHMCAACVTARRLLD